MKDIGKTHVAKLVKPKGGFLGGRHIPKERINHNTWAQLLRIEKPPLDGSYILKSAVDPDNVKQQAKDVRKTMEVSELVTLMKLAAANKKINAKSLRVVPKHYSEAPTVSDWNEISPDVEADYLGLEQLKDGQSVSIIGAGISGLTMAYILNKSRPDLKISIFDKNEQPGGWMRTERLGDAILESGPRTLLPSHPGTQVLIEILHQLNQLDQLVGVPKSSPTNTKGLVYNNSIIEMPSNLWSSIKFLFTSPILKDLTWPMLKEIWRKPRAHDHPEESVGEFVSRRFSPEFNDRIISAILRGIYAADSNTLSARSVARFKKMYYLERTEEMGILSGGVTGSLGYLDAYLRRVVPMLTQSLIVPERKANDKIDHGFDPKKFSLFGMRDGIQSLAEILATQLQKTRNVDFHLGTEIKKLEPSKNSVTLETQSGATLTSDMALVNAADPKIFGDKSLRTDVESVAYSSLAVVNVSSSDVNLCKDWFGILVPKSEDKRNPEGILGIIFDSSVRNASEPVVTSSEPLAKSPSALTVMLGGDLWKDMTAQEATDRALNGLERILGPFDRTKVTTRATLQKNSIPIYAVGHSQLANKVHERISHVYKGRVALSGMAFGRGVGVSDCVLDSLFLATRFSPQRQLLHPEFFFNEMWTVSRPDWYA